MSVRGLLSQAAHSGPAKVRHCQPSPSPIRRQRLGAALEVLSEAQERRKVCRSSRPALFLLRIAFPQVHRMFKFHVRASQMLWFAAIAAPETEPKANASCAAPAHCLRPHGRSNSF
ncbi:hypothetical protein EVAR_63371_1 [Eumeta japonica]|uniref:Uncharacterized protein n=1 Tax=Eumeta variegata TaxID=151549 RepID=A0A4C2A1Q0_EUMVA|nr:hypothetical protein EVAR_63371_1 [Eumeta japonica]